METEKRVIDYVVTRYLMPQMDEDGCDVLQTLLQAHEAGEGDEFPVHHVTQEEYDRMTNWDFIQLINEDMKQLSELIVDIIDEAVENELSKIR